VSQENVEVVRSIYDAVNRLDWDAAFRDQRPDVELIIPPGLNEGTYRGRDECQGYWESWLSVFEAFSAEPEEFFESGDQVVVFVKSRARPKGASAEIEVRNGHLWTIRDGKAASMRLFPEPQKALEAAGLAE
jgi:ketosteroid isomerase-like protein